MLPGLQAAIISYSNSLSTKVINFFKKKIQEIANLYHLKMQKNMIRSGMCACVCM